MNDLQIAIILGSTRPGRNGKQVADWLHLRASKRPDATYELVDLADHPLPLLDEPVPPSMGQYSKDHTKEWAQTIAPFDGFIFVTPEYNHSTSGALKNALDYLYAEWNNKAAGFVAYGSVGGARAIEHLRGICAELQIATVRQQLSFSLFTDFKDHRDFEPGEQFEEQATTLFDQVEAWSRALKTIRSQ